MKKFVSILSLFCLTLCAVQAENGTLLIPGPNQGALYQLSSLSPNGKWACGIIQDDIMRGFLWNVTTGEVTVLSPSGETSVALDVSNDGMVVGSFMDPEASSTGVKVESAGYWKDGRWHHLDNKSGDVIVNSNGGGMANCVSANGRYIGGEMYVNGTYSPVRWTDGVLDKIYETGQMVKTGQKCHGSIYDISDDGQNGCGWVEHPEKGVRTPMLWMGNDTIYLDYAKSANVTPRTARKFSPDGRKVLAYDRVYDIETRTSSARISAIYSSEYGEFFTIDNDGTVYGYLQPFAGRQYGAVVKDGQLTYFENLMAQQGADLGEYTMVAQVLGVSEDKKTYAVISYNAAQIATPLLVRLDENVTTREPVALSARQLDGLYAMKLSWKAPLANAEAVVGYNIYRDDVKLNAEPVRTMTYLDTNLEKGTYAYTVKAVYAAAESVASEAFVAEVVDKEVNAPRNVYGLQAGANSVRLMWNAPASNRPSLGYYDEGEEIDGLGGGAYSFEGAIRFPKEELALYGTRQIAGLSFYPMSQQNEWKLNVYQVDEAGTMTRLASETMDASSFVYGTENRVLLGTPIDLPAGKDIIVGVEVDATNYGGLNTLGMVYGKVNAGYSDLIRQKGEEAFYSTWQDAQEAAEAYDFSMCWAMKMLLGNQADSEVDKVSSYIVLENGIEQGRVETTSFRKNDLADGTYTYEVKAVYANGQQSSASAADVTVQFNSSACYKPVMTRVQTEGGKLMVDWTAPLDDDATHITYASGVSSPGLVGPADQNYNYMVAAIYDNTFKLKGFDPYVIKGFRFYPLCKADFTFYLQKGATTIAEYYVEDYNLSAWNTVLLDEPIALEAGATYTLMLDCYDVETGKAPIGLDKNLSMTGYSDLYSYDGGANFLALADEDVYGNWMIGLYVADPAGEPLPVKGYNVRIGMQKENEELLTETHFEKVYDAKRTSFVNVGAVYDAEGTEKEVKGDNVYFTVEPADAIDAATWQNLRVLSRDGLLTVEGEVKGLKLYTATGVEVARSAGNSLRVSALGRGVYVLAISIDGEEKLVKVAL